MKDFKMITSLIILLLNGMIHSKMSLSEIVYLRNDFKIENAKLNIMPKERKLSVVSLDNSVTLKATGSISPSKIDRYLKPVLSRNLQNSEDSMFEEETPRIIKIEQINEKTGAVVKLLQSFDNNFPLKERNLIAKNEKTINENIADSKSVLEEFPTKSIEQEKASIDNRNKENPKPQIGSVRIDDLLLRNLKKTNTIESSNKQKMNEKKNRTLKKVINQTAAPMVKPPKVIEVVEEEEEDSGVKVASLYRGYKHVPHQKYIDEHNQIQHHYDVHKKKNSAYV